MPVLSAKRDVVSNFSMASSSDELELESSKLLDSAGSTLPVAVAVRGLLDRPPDVVESLSISESSELQYGNNAQPWVLLAGHTAALLVLN
jgi:hypothetical protein